MTQEAQDTGNAETSLTEGRPEVLCGLQGKAGGAKVVADSDGQVRLFSAWYTDPVFAGREIVIRMTAERIIISCGGGESFEICAATT
jgi:hypothetical protein